LFIRDSEKYVKEGSGNGQLSPQGSRWGSWQGARFIAEFERQMEDSGNEASLSI